jgi:hypothetical protein
MGKGCGSGRQVSGSFRGDVKLMGCHECDRLLARSRYLERIYTVTVDELTARIATSSAREYIDLQSVSGNARSDSDTARFELQKHKRSHVNTG